MPLNDAQGYRAAPGLLWPCTGRADGFEIPPQVPKVGQAKRLRFPATGLSQDCQHGIPLQGPMPVVDQRNEVPGQRQSRSGKGYEVRSGGVRQRAFVVFVLQQGVDPEFNSDEAIPAVSDFGPHFAEGQVPRRAAETLPNSTRSQRRRPVTRKTAQTGLGGACPLIGRR